MKNTLFFLFVIALFSACSQDTTVVVNEIAEQVDLSDCEFEAPIYVELTGEELKSQLKDCFTPLTSYSYTNARRYLYSEVDVYNGMLNTIYSKYSVRIQPSGTQSYISAAFDAGINAEHIFPQSQGAGEEPARSDMYHLYPERAEVNSARSFSPFANISNNNVNAWFLGDATQTATPSNPGDWAKVNNNFFEPSDDRKGDVARSVFYFVLIYEDVANMSYFDSMKDTLLEWNQQDQVDQRERTRRNRIQALQGNDNPFISDPGLANRLYGN